MAESKATLKVDSDVSGAKKGLKETEEGVKKLGTTASGIGASLKAAFLPLLAVGGVVAVIKKSVSAYQEAEAASNKLSASLKNQGIFSDQLVKKYEEQAAAIQRTTAFEGDAVIAGQASLQNMIGQLEITPELTRAVTDLAAGTGMDLEQAFAMVGKTIGTSTNALARSGIEVDANASKQEKLAAIVASVNEKFGGQGAATASGLGALKQLGNAFGDILELIGSKFAPIISSLAGLLAKLFNDASGQSSKFSKALDVAFTIILTPLNFLIKVINKTVDTFRNLLPAVDETKKSAMDLQPVFEFLGKVLSGVADVIGNVIGTALVKAIIIFRTIGDVIAFLIEKTQELVQTFKAVGDAAGNFLNKAKGFLGFKSAIAADTKAINDQAKAIENRNETAATAPEAAPKAEEKKDDAAAKEAADREKRITELKSQIEMENALKEGAGKEEIEILKKTQEAKNKFREAELEKDAEIRGLLLQQARAAEEELLAMKQEFAAKEAELAVSKRELDIEFGDKIKEEDLVRLQDKLITEREAAQQVALEQAEAEVANQNLRLANQAKFGKAYAALEDMKAKSVLTGTLELGKALFAAAGSSSKGLFRLSKAAGIAEATINTFRAANQALANPPGPPFTLPIVAATIAQGIAQVSQIKGQEFSGAALGGIVSGPAAGVRDSVPMMLQPGELVVPKPLVPDFTQAVGANINTGQGNGSTTVTIGFTPDAAQFITAEQFKGQQLGTTRAA